MTSYAKMTLERQLEIEKMCRRVGIRCVTSPEKYANSDDV